MVVVGRLTIVKRMKDKLADSSCRKADSISNNER